MAHGAESSEDAKDDHGASLARLRLFLAPHSSPPKAILAIPAPTPSADENSHDQDAVTGNSRRQASSSPVTQQCDAGDPLKESDPESVAPLSPQSSDVSDEATMVSGQVTIPASGATASVSPLGQSTKEFARVKHLLQCCLPGFLVHDDDVAMWEMTNPSLVAQYAQHAHNLLELDSWVAVNDLGAAMGDVHSYGFTSLDASQTGMKFTTGNVQLGIPAETTTTGGSWQQQLVLCKIAVGRSLVITSESEATTRLPPGYNSFYLRPPMPTPTPQQHEQEPTTTTAAGMEPDLLAERGYCHEYILDNTGQILPQYLVRFRVSALGAKAAGPCALCEKHAAVVLCRACEAELCSACDHDVHSANKLVSRHKRVPVRQRPTTAAATTRAARRRSSASSASSAAVAASDLSAEESPHSSLQRPGSAASLALDADVATAALEKQLEDGLTDAQTLCRLHRDKRVEFYCSVCELPVCVHCKMVGDHSVGEKGSHRLLTVTDAYALSVHESLKPDPLVESRKSVLENKLFALAQARAAVERNRDDVAAAIALQCQQALERLEDEARAKVCVLDGECLEFQRQLQQIEWAEDALEDLRATSPAVAFLSLWNQHRVVRAEQRDFPAFAHGFEAEHVKGDLELVGRLQVVSREHHGDVVGCDALEGTSRLNSSRTTSKRSLQGQQSPSESDVRRRMLSMKPVTPSESATLPWRNLAGSVKEQPGTVYPSSTTLSARCIAMIAEIRSELLSQSPLLRGSYASTMTSRSILTPSPVARARASLSTRTTARTLPFQGGDGLAPTTPQRSRLVSDAWATLLRHELAFTPMTTEKQTQGQPET